MRKFVTYILLAVILCFSAAVPSFAQESTPAQESTSAAGPSDEIGSIVGQLFQCISTNDYDTAISFLNDTMKSQVTTETLKQLWDSLQTQEGAFKGQVATKTEKSGEYLKVIVTCKFEKGFVDFTIVFDNTNKIAGLRLDPSTYSDVAVKMPDSITEKDVTVGNGEWKLPGTLTMPKGKGPFYAVVLVQGSGPKDRDETIGPNKPFRDLAWGLAAQGMAVLRYDKRTKVYADKLAKVDVNFTVKEEYIDDVMAAVALLKKTPGINTKKIFVVGHSLGAMLLPRIGAKDGSIAGLVSMAGPARPFEDLMLEQYTYLVSLDQTMTKADKDKYLAGIKAQVNSIKSPKLSAKTPATQLLGAPGSYWLDLRGYNPPAAASKLKQPMLVLQGGRDYQVTTVDYNLWKKGCSAKKNMTYKLYPDLNHLFMTGKGKSTPQEYNQQGNVSPTVIQDIGAWIKKN